MSFRISLGSKVKDCVTGFSGVVTGRAEYLTGCRQYSVMGRAKDGKSGDGMWFDEDRLEIVGKPVVLPRKANNGGPADCEAPLK